MKNKVKILLLLFVSVVSGICRIIMAETYTSFFLSEATIDSVDKKANTFFKADNEFIQYIGRIDFSNLQKPKFWAPGVYIKAKYKGTTCSIVFNDNLLWGKNQNYLEIVIDDTILHRIKASGVKNEITVGENLHYGIHSILICKDTEANIGYIEFLGLKCEELLPPEPKPSRKIEFIGNSITCGTGSDLSEIPCDSGEWHDQHNAYMSYGPVTAKNLNAQWHLSSFSGIGMIHSCCNLNYTITDVFDKLGLYQNKTPWNFNQYIPDVVTICLGQNDGIQDSILFCNAYVNFIKEIRSYYPNAQIVCLTSPMANKKLTQVLKNYLTGIVEFAHKSGDDKVSKYFFSKSYNNGCRRHPDIEDHTAIANELTEYLKEIMDWY